MAGLHEEQHNHYIDETKIETTIHVNTVRARHIFLTITMICTLLVDCKTCFDKDVGYQGMLCVWQKMQVIRRSQTKTNVDSCGDVRTLRVACYPGT